MTVSIVIPAHNAAEHVEMTVPAVLALEGVTEWIWVDDGSTDDTSSLLHRLTSHVPRAHVIQHAQNKGRSEARNTGVEAARSEVIAFLDVDVRPRPGYLAAHLAVLDDARVIASIGRVVHADLHPGDPYSIYLLKSTRGPKTQAGPTSWKHFLAGAACIRADALRRAGGFNPGILYGEDAELACRLASDAPDGLWVAPGAVVDVYGTETLEGARAKARQFGASLRQIVEVHPDALRLLELARMETPFLGRVLRSRGLAQLVEAVMRLAPTAGVVRGVRYLLAHEVLRGYRDA